MRGRTGCWPLPAESRSVIPIRDINPTARFPLVTILIIGINCAVFLYQLTLGRTGEEHFIAAHAFIPKELFLPVAADMRSATMMTLITSLFLHGGILHIAGNMLYLWIFGNNVEDAMTRIRFVLFYLLCGIAATGSHALQNPSSAVPLIGASGAISGVLGAYLLLYPRARVLTLMMFGFYIRTVSVPAMVVLGFWFVFQFLSVLATSSTGGGVAWGAHIGGFISGLLLTGLFKRRDVPFWGGRSYRYI